MLYFCVNKTPLVNWFKKFLMSCINVGNISMIKLLLFDTSSLSKKKKNVATILISSYICNIWYNRDSQFDKLYLLKKRIMQQHKDFQFILKEKMGNLFTETYCKINQRYVDNIDVG